MLCLGLVRAHVRRRDIRVLLALLVNLLVRRVLVLLVLVLLVVGLLLVGLLAAVFRADHFLGVGVELRRLVLVLGLRGGFRVGGFGERRQPVSHIQIAIQQSRRQRIYCITAVEFGIVLY